MRSPSTLAHLILLNTLPLTALSFGMGKNVQTFLSMSTATEVDALDTSKIKEGPSIPPVPSTSKRIFYVRHGEVIPPGGAHGVFYGSLDVPLSPLGEMEAKAAAHYLSQHPLQLVASSPLKRAKYGANEVLGLQERVRKERGDILVFEGFTELDRGEWCGKTKTEIGAEMLARFDACDESITPVGGESYPQLKQRVLEARDSLLDVMDCGESSALVSHLQVTRSVLSDALDIPTDKMTGIAVATASVTCIDYCGQTGQSTVHFSSFKPEAGLAQARDGGNVV